jgi:hypothetical protein
MDVSFDNHIISYKLRFLTRANEGSLKSIGLKSIGATNQQPTNSADPRKRVEVGL